MKEAINRIAIVGGGSAGWLSAAYLAKHFQIGKPGAVEIVLIESESVETIGVGEATVPTLRGTIHNLGIPEGEFMRATSATFKQAIRFDDWEYLPKGDDRSSYFHTFQPPIMTFGREIAAYWIMTQDEHNLNFVDYSRSQGRVCEEGLGPFVFGEKLNQISLKYAYHFDAVRFAHYLKGFSTKRGVEHRLGHVTEVHLAEDGSISHLSVEGQEDLHADFFIDCTGFGSHLIEKKLGSKFRDGTDILFCDSAVALQVPYEEEEPDINPFTTSTAKSEGWIWDIGLVERQGIGHVYSSRHTTEDEAEKVLREYVGPRGDGLNARKLKMRIGYREKSWIKNCLAMGLSAGFIEPLESTGIHQIEISLERFSNLFTRKGDLNYMAELYNEQTAQWFDLTFDFIKIHYCLSKRDDSEFWIENRQPESIPERLGYLLEQWKYRPFNYVDVPERRATFGATNYHQVLFGMGFVPDISKDLLSYPHINLARTRAEQNQKRIANDLRRLPTHRELLDQVYNS